MKSSALDKAGTFLLLFLVWCSTKCAAHSIDEFRLTNVEPLSQVRVRVVPRSSNFFEKRAWTANPNHIPSARSIEHDDHLRLQFSSHNQSFHLHLTPNLNLLHPQAVSRLNGIELPIRHDQFRIYRGHVVDPALADELVPEALTDDNPRVLGWARMVLRPDLMHDPLDSPVFEGSFRVMGDMYHVKTAHHYHRTRRSDDKYLETNETMVIYRDSDLLRRSTPDTPSSTCAVTNQLGWHDTLPGLSMSFGKRATVGCPSTLQVNYMGVAADCTYTRHYQSVENARMQLLTDFNTASAVYESSFNVILGLINMTVMSEVCPSTPSTITPWNQNCNSNYTINNRLNDFSRWRGTMSNDGAGLWHLITTCSSGSDVGLSWMRQLCNTGVSLQTVDGQQQYVSGTSISTVVRDEWKVIAHEVGHGFGAIHDCTAATCPCSTSCSCCPLSDTVCDSGGQYIMNPASNVTTNEFSPCSISTICGLYPLLATCLKDPGQRTTLHTNMCGNGIIEPGEDCDPGGMPSNCCNPSTCRFLSGAVCDEASGEECCQNCQLRQSGYVCRPAQSSCDIAEMCTGTNSSCPADRVIADTTSCGNGLQCASGQCTSRDLQCITQANFNMTGACPSYVDSCQLVCQDASAQCYVIAGQFLDGTVCGQTSTCQNGTCVYSGNQASAWLSSHLDVAIPVGSVLGVLVVAGAGFGLWWCIRRRQRLRGQNHSRSTSHADHPPPSPFYHAQTVWPASQVTMAPNNLASVAPAYKGSVFAPFPTRTLDLSASDATVASSSQTDPKSTCAHPPPGYF